MKRYIALTIVVLISLASVTKITLAGPEPLPSGKEMREVAPAPPACDWSGFYIGIQGGWTGGTLDWKDVDFGDSEILIHDNTDSFMGGGTVGYNHQFGSWLVLGAEGDFSWWDGGGRRRTSRLSGEEEETTTWRTDSNWIGTIGLRAGVTSMNNHLLAYVKAGAAFEHWNYHELSTQTALNSGTTVLENRFDTDETRVAPMIAFGLEYAINCHWSVKAEYKHLFLGRDTITGRAIDPPGTEPESFDVEMYQYSVQAGLNYKF